MHDVESFSESALTTKRRSQRWIFCLFRGAVVRRRSHTELRAICSDPFARKKENCQVGPRRQSLHVTRRYSFLWVGLQKWVVPG
jgi:hypothetical protein